MKRSPVRASICFHEASRYPVVANQDGDGRSAKPLEQRERTSGASTASHESDIAFWFEDNSLINNRQIGRRRGRGGNGGGNPRQGGGRMDTGNRIDNRARGNASQLHEKYRNLARDAQMQGDRVNTEYYLQFADHYFRVLSEQRGRADDQLVRRQQRDAFDDGLDSEDYGDEGEQARPSEQSRPRGQYNRDETRDRSSRADEVQHRSSRDEDAGEEAHRGRTNREDAPERRPRRERTRVEEPVRDEAAVAISADEQQAEAPRRRGRPRRQPESASAELPAALDADRLPPSLSAASTGEGSEDAPKPRRRRTRLPTPEASAAE